MARLVAILATTHHPFYYQTSQLPPDQAPPFAAAWVAKVAAYRQTLTRARPDVLVMVGSDHFHQLWLDNMPQFLVGKAPFYDANYYNEEREFGLPRQPFLRLIEANRIDQRVGEYETWEALRRYCVHSADPCGRLVLGVLRRLDDPEAVGLSDDVCTGLQLVNFLQDVPRDLALGRVYLPAEDRRRFGVTELDRPNEPLRRLLAFEAERGRALLVSGEELGKRLGGRTGRAVADWMPRSLR